MGFKLKKIFGSNAGGTVGMLAGGTIGAFTGNPMLGAEIGGQLGSMVGPSDERLQRRQEIQAQRDAISFWNMQNEYNSPLQQRIRLEQAGLNPYALNGSVPDNTASSVSVPSVSYRSKRKGNWSAVEKFFLNKSMQNAEDQNMRNELINENWRLRNLKLAEEIEKKGNVRLANKIRKDKPISLSEAKYKEQRYKEATEPHALGSRFGGTATGYDLLENIVYRITDFALNNLTKSKIRDTISDNPELFGRRAYEKYGSY